MSKQNPNYITYEEASHRWCPLVRNVFRARREDRGVTSFNADRLHNKCIVVHCAVWYDNGDGTGCCGMNYMAGEFGR